MAFERQFQTVSAPQNSCIFDRLLGLFGCLFAYLIVCLKFIPLCEKKKQKTKTKTKKNKNKNKKHVRLKVDMPILTCIFFTFKWLTLTSEMQFVKFHPEVASCLLSRGKRKYAPPGMRLLWKYIRNYFLVYHLTSHFLLYLQNYKEFEAEILD